MTMTTQPPAVFGSAASGRAASGSAASGPAASGSAALGLSASGPAAFDATAFATTVLEPMGTPYEAVTRCGPVRLLILGSAPAPHAIDAAIALDDCAVLLDELDAWVGEALDWRWCAVPPSPGEPRAAMDWAQASPGAIRCRVEMPWALLRTLPAPNDLLKAGLSWAEVPVIVSLARFDLEPAEVQAIEAGGAVVLPDSFAAEWCGRLREAGEPVGAGIPISLADPLRPRALASPVGTQDGDGGPPRRYEVCVFGRGLFPVDRLAGWSTWDFDLPDTGVRMWRCAMDGSPAQCVATGRLMPWGTGFALAVETLV